MTIGASVPGLYSANADGAGVAAAIALRATAGIHPLSAPAAKAVGLHLECEGLAVLGLTPNPRFGPASNPSGGLRGEPSYFRSTLAVQ
jgi:hypothetical protein